MRKFHVKKDCRRDERKELKIKRGVMSFIKLFVCFFLKFTTNSFSIEIEPKLLRLSTNRLTYGHSVS